MRKWLVAVLLGIMLTAGCSGGGQQQPQASAEPSSDQVEKAVKKTLHEDDMKDFLRTSVRTEGGGQMLEMALDTQEGQKAVQESVKRALGSATGQQAIGNKVGEMMTDPTFKVQVQQAIRDTIMEMMAKGSEGAKKKEGGSAKGGGGSSGGGGGS